MRRWKKIMIIGSAILLIAIDYLYLRSSNSEHKRRQPLPASSTELHSDNTRCQIPTLDPFDLSVAHFFKSPSTHDLECDGPEPLVFVNGSTIIRITNNATLLKQYGADECYYKSAKRSGDDKFVLGDSQYFKTVANVTDEFIQVECKNDKSKVVFTDYFPFINRKKDAEQRVQRILKKRGPRKERLRIVLLGLDSMSRSQFIRHMNKTSIFIKEKLTFVELQAYNKVGAYTFPNILAFFTGMTEEESATDMSATYADVLPLIWKDFAKDGYRTLYAADTPYISIFNFGKRGFKDQPVDYYWRPFGLAVENSPLITNGKRGCYNRRPETKVILKWTEDFLDTFPYDPLFAFSYHTRLSHGDLVEPRLLDKPIQEFLQSLHTKGHFNNTILFFFGDHGFRYGDFRTTYVGRMEDKLPFAFLIFPEWFPWKYPTLYTNLQINQHRLTTPFDMFATLRNILDFTGQVKLPDPHDRSISLLNSEIPENRTCKDAGIQPQFCACVQRQRTDIADPRVQAAAKEIVKAVNSFTEKARYWCAKLVLGAVLDASVQEVMTGDAGNGGKISVLDFLLIVELLPSEGMFEGTVWYSSVQETYTVDKNIERINLYRNQSSCINDSTLKPFCYCLTT